MVSQQSASLEIWLSFLDEVRGPDVSELEYHKTRLLREDLDTRPRCKKHATVGRGFRSLALMIILGLSLLVN